MFLRIQVFHTNEGILHRCKEDKALEMGWWCLRAPCTCWKMSRHPDISANIGADSGGDPEQGSLSSRMCIFLNILGFPKTRDKLHRVFVYAHTQPAACRLDFPACVHVKMHLQPSQEAVRAEALSAELWVIALVSRQMNPLPCPPSSHSMMSLGNWLNKDWSRHLEKNWFGRRRREEKARQTWRKTEGRRTERKGDYRRWGGVMLRVLMVSLRRVILCASSVIQANGTLSLTVMQARAPIITLLNLLSSTKKKKRLLHSYSKSLASLAAESEARGNPW